MNADIKCIRKYRVQSAPFFLLFLVGLYQRKSCGMLSAEQEKMLKENEKRKNMLTKKLRIKIQSARRQKQFRKEKNKRMAKLIMSNPDCNKILNIRNAPGRPRIEEDQPGLLEAICDIAQYGASAHERRQCEIFRSVKTLEQLAEGLETRGFHLSRNAVYVRLLPKRSISSEGRRHVKTVPVKLARAQNDRHKKHIDSHFCTSTIKHLEEIASILRPKQVCFLSQDDKARVALGITAANKQSPILMHLEYKVSLPDHDWVEAEKHKLIPSVYAFMQIRENGLGDTNAVGYSAPTFIGIRSGKHSSSTAFSHAKDIERILELSVFEEFTKFNGSTKPIFICVVDGGPDENPRYKKVINIGIHHFVKNNVGALFIACNAPGRSAFNKVERRMAPLSKELSGLIHPHDKFGSHLDNQCRTIDEVLEKKKISIRR